MQKQTKNTYFHNLLKISKIVIGGGISLPLWFVVSHNRINKTEILKGLTEYIRRAYGVPALIALLSLCLFSCTKEEDETSQQVLHKSSIYADSIGEQPQQSINIIPVTETININF